jgi:hypothetical protein
MNAELICPPPTLENVCSSCNRFIANPWHNFWWKLSETHKSRKLDLASAKDRLKKILKRKPFRWFMDDGPRIKRGEKNASRSVQNSFVTCFVIYYFTWTNFLALFQRLQPTMGLAPKNKFTSNKNRWFVIDKKEAHDTHQPTTRAFFLSEINRCL